MEELEKQIYKTLIEITILIKEDNKIEINKKRKELDDMLEEYLKDIK